LRLIFPGEGVTVDLSTTSSPELFISGYREQKSHLPASPPPEIGFEKNRRHTRSDRHPACAPEIFSKVAIERLLEMYSVPNHSTL
jgi:hypothetical protein